MRVTAANDADLAGILAIHNEVVATSTAIYAFETSTLAERRAWLHAAIGAYDVR